MDCNPMTSRRYRMRLRLLGAVAILLLLGALLICRTVAQADREMRAELIEQTRLVAQALNADSVQALTGTEADLGKPEYVRLKEQLAATRSLYPQCRFLYLMGRRAGRPAVRLPPRGPASAVPVGGTLFFLVDNEPVGSPDYSPPGQVYEDAPDVCGRVFDTGVAAVDGPTADRWGTWVTGLIPILDPRQSSARPAGAGEPAGDATVGAPADPGSGAVLAVLGMDIDARNWNALLVRAVLPPARLTLALTVLVLAGAALWARRSRITGVAPGWMWRLEPALATALGLVLTLFAAWAVHDRETHDRRHAFAQLAASRTEVIAEALRDLRNIELESLARFYESDEEISPEEFRHFTAHLAEALAVQAWEWVAAVPAVDTPRFEAAARAAGLTGFEIWEKDARGQRAPASGRELYYPVLQVAPLAGNEPALGFDLGSEPLRRAALEAAAHSGLCTATDPVSLVQETGNQKGMLVCRPVFDHREPQRLRGLAVAVLRLQDLVLRSANPDHTLFLGLSLLRSGAPAEPLATGWDADSVSPAAGLAVTRPVLAFGKVFGVTAYAGPEFARLHPQRAGWLVALTGLGLTAALTMAIGLLLRRREELEVLVAERTRELRDNETRFDQLAAQSGTVVWEVEAKGLY